MVPIKEEVLLGIYDVFEQWENEEKVCKKGCAACCSQNVLITAVEGDLIHRYVREQGMREEFARRLQRRAPSRKVAMTTNGFAARCLEGKDVEPESYGSEKACPFLEDNSCIIYGVRPFSCRCFISSTLCGPGSPATVDETYLSAASAVMQVIEHLGQGEYLGNMLDVLLALCDLPENRKYTELLPASLADQGRAHVTKALPLPGFLLMEEEMEKVGPLLEAIFACQVGGKSVEVILNNG
ncbi:MAG: YkgJ family cysteine cluster protein [Thermodesulfobacteriota bacterium]